VDRGLPDDLHFRTLWDIACVERKLERNEAAIAPLTDLACCPNAWRVPALEELAKHYERRERNFAMALEMTVAALELQPASDALARRRARLEKRLAQPKSRRLL
jgi:hypothetical protein